MNTTTKDEWKTVIQIGSMVTSLLGTLLGGLALTISNVGNTYNIGPNSNVVVSSQGVTVNTTPNTAQSKDKRIRSLLEPVESSGKINLLSEPAGNSESRIKPLRVEDLKVSDLKIERLTINSLPRRDGTRVEPLKIVRTTLD